MNFSFDTKSGEYKTTVKQNNANVDIVVATKSQVDEFTEQIENWLAVCNGIIGVTAFNLALGAAGTNHRLFHLTFSIFFLIALHFYSYRFSTKAFFEFECITPALQQTDRDELTGEFRRFIRDRHFSAIQMIKKTPLWFFGVFYLFMIFILSAVPQFSFNPDTITCLKTHYPMIYSLVFT